MELLLCLILAFFYNSLFYFIKKFLNVKREFNQNFLKAVRKNIPENIPENYGKDVDFECPICGGEAWCVRLKENGSVHAGCKSCGYSLK